MQPYFSYFYNMSVSIQHLTKIYGQQKAVNDLSLEVNSGEILGFLGPNGAGKSTTMKVVTCYTPPTSGQVSVCGYDVTTNDIEARRQIGYLPEHNPLYLDMYVHEYLRFVGGTYGIKGKSLTNRVEDMVELVGLSLEQNKKIGTLSKGYRQRVGLAQALIHDPEVLILDEPTTGLDPNQLVEVRNVIQTIAKDKTVILSTHIMQEVEAMCSRVAIINRGVLVANQKIDELSRNAVVTLELAHEIESEILKSIEGVLAVKAGANNSFEIEHNADQDIRPALFDLIKAKDWQMIGMQQKENSLESIFQSITQDV